MTPEEKFVIPGILELRTRKTRRSPASPAPLRKAKWAQAFQTAAHVKLRAARTGAEVNFSVMPFDDDPVGDNESRSVPDRPLVVTKGTAKMSGRASGGIPPPLSAISTKKLALRAGCGRRCGRSVHGVDSVSTRLVHTWFSSPP